MEEVVKTAAEAAGGISVGAFLALVAALVTAITTLGEVIKSQVQKKTNPLNGTLSKLDATLTQVNTTLSQVAMRTEDSNRVLGGHTEKLIVMSTSVAQLAANEAAQTQALLSLKPAIDGALTGCATRIIGHCDARSKSILDAVDK